REHPAPWNYCGVFLIIQNRIQDLIFCITSPFAINILKFDRQGIHRV
ncbi:MAG: hypothetical protein ACI9YB_000092, partial [Halioglobus sp.]